MLPVLAEQRLPSGWPAESPTGDDAAVPSRQAQHVEMQAVKQAQLINALRSAGAQLECRDTMGRTPLAVAVVASQQAAVQTLLGEYCPYCVNSPTQRYCV